MPEQMDYSQRYAIRAGRAASYQPPYTPGSIKMGGNGGSGLVVIQYFA